MSLDCKNEEKISVDSGNKLTSINKVLDILLGAFNLNKKPSANIPPYLLLTGAKLKPGMSARNLAANVISRMESDIGIPMGDVFADGPNAISAAMLVQAQEQISHIQQNAKITSVVAPGAMLIKAIGANAAGAVVVEGSNVSVTATNGVIS